MADNNPPGGSDGNPREVHDFGEEQTALALEFVETAHPKLAAANQLSQALAFLKTQHVLFGSLQLKL